MKLFSLMAGRSENTFNFGEVEFEAAPLTIAEYGEYLALKQVEGNTYDVRCEYLGLKLRQRLRSRHDPAMITTDWMMERLSVPELLLLEYVLVYGELPEKDDGGGEKKA